MDLHEPPEDRAFREEARTWLSEHVPREVRPTAGQAMRDFDLAWQRAQHDGGWAGISWPVAHGGRGESLVRHMIWNCAKVAARFVGLAQSTLAKLRLNGNGPVYCKLGRRVVYRPSDLEQWLQSRTARDTSDADARFLRALTVAHPR